MPSQFPHADDNWYTIGSHTLYYEEQQTVVVVDQRVVPLTPLHMKLLKPLLSCKSVGDGRLARHAYKSVAMPEIVKNIERQVREMNNRLEPHGLTITRVAKRAFQLTEIPEPE